MSAKERIAKAIMATTVPPENVVIKRADLALLMGVFQAAEDMPDLAVLRRLGFIRYEDEVINLTRAVVEFGDRDD